MYDQRKASELENRSHVRGKLNKQFFLSEQQELERKRRQMKAILDQQVQQKRRQKEKEKYQNDRILQQQQDKIKFYYAQVEERERKIVSNGPQHRLGSGVYDNKLNIMDNRDSPMYQSKKSSSPQHQDNYGNIPVMEVMQNSDKIVNYGNNHQQNLSLPSKNHLSPHRISAGNIPLLQLSQQQLKRQQKKQQKKVKSKKDDKYEREKQITERQKYERERQRSEKEKSDREKSDRQKSLERDRQRERQRFERQSHKYGNDRKNTVQEESIPGSRQYTQFKQVFGDINEEIQVQNVELRKQLKKNQQAISLLIGAVRSNAKLDKYRVQAEKILSGGQSINAKNSQQPRKSSNQEQKQKQLMLPQLKLRHQSIMHDYMLGSAKKAHLKVKNFK